MEEEREVEALIKPVSNEDTDPASQQQSAHQLVIATGNHEPERLRETEVRLPYGVCYNVGIITDVMGRRWPHLRVLQRFDQL